MSRMDEVRLSQAGDTFNVIAAVSEDDPWPGDQEVFDLLKDRLYVAAICDILDSLGYRQQAMHHRLRPLIPDMNRCGFVGRARTLRWMQTDYIDETDPYGAEIEAMDSLGPNDVVIHSTDPTGCSAPWGELMTTVAMRNGAVGCICDSMIRDCTRIIELGFPVYYAGIRALDSKGRTKVMAYDVPVACGDVMVKPGDIVFADFDGIVVIPQEVETSVCRLALEKVDKENLTRAELLQGKSLREVFEKYRTL